MTARSGRLAAVGAIAANGSQAAASLTLQVVAARILGLSGLGVYAAFFAVIVFLTAISTGFVGDTLTVLDRTRPDIRLGLQVSCVVIALVAGIACFGISSATGVATLRAAIAFGAATTVFILEDAFRRLLMANIMFWRIVVVDGTALLVSLAVVISFLVTDADVTVGVIFGALAAGQIAAIGVAWLVLPPNERRLGRGRHLAFREIFGYGSWRAVNQAVRPALFAVVKTASVVIVGALLAGQLEAARIYMAPAMLLVGGMSSFLFASYARKRDVPLLQLRRRTDRDVGILAGVIGVYSVLAVLALPWLGDLVVGDGVDLPVVAVAGWAVYGASVAAVTPYGSLAAVRGRQAAVLGWRVADSVLSLALALAVMAVTGGVGAVPWALAVGSVLGGLAIRFFVLRPEETSPAPVAGATNEAREAGVVQGAPGVNGTARDVESQAPATSFLKGWLAPSRISLILLTLATVSWRADTYFSGGFDPVVLAKAGLSVIALVVAFVLRSRCREPIPIGTRSVWFLLAYCTITFFGAWGYGTLLATVVLIIRILIVASTVMLLARTIPFAALFSDMLSAMTLVVMVSVLTGLGGAASGRLSGGIPPLGPNGIAMVAGLVIIATFWKALLGTAAKSDLAFAGLMTVILWATGSRTGLGALVVALVLMVVVCGRLRPQVFVAVVVGSAGIFYVLFGTGLISGFFERGGSENLTTLSSRTVAWSAAFEFPQNAWTTWMGAGLSTKQIPVQGQYWATQILDSSWISALVQAGYLGALLLAAWVLSVAVASMRCPREPRVLLIGLTVYLVGRSILESGLFDSTLPFMAFWLISLVSDRTSRATFGSGPGAERGSREPDVPLAIGAGPAER